MILKTLLFLISLVLIGLIFFYLKITVHLRGIAEIGKKNREAILRFSRNAAIRSEENLRAILNCRKRLLNGQSEIKELEQNIEIQNLMILERVDGRNRPEKDEPGRPEDEPEAC